MRKEAYPISRQGLNAIRDYMEHERRLDKDGPALFLPAAINSKGRLTPLAVNQIWNEVCVYARVKGKSPHTARHAMGRHIIDKTGNIAAVQRQLGHKNAACSVQYTRVTDKEMQEVLNDRG